MEESAKNKLILILAVLTAILFVVSVSSCSNSRHQKTARDKEMAMRLDLEERVSKFTQEKKAVEEKLDNANKALEQEKAAEEAAKKALEQEQLVTQSLKEELQKVTKLKTAAEEKLKDALDSNKAKSKKTK